MLKQENLLDSKDVFVFKKKNPVYASQNISLYKNEHENSVSKDSCGSIFSANLRQKMEKVKKKHAK